MAGQRLVVELDSEGCFPLPAAPGLGVEIDWDAAAEHPRERVHFDLFEQGWERREARREA